MAADITQSFMGKHGEKVAVGVAALILIGAVAWFIAMRQPQNDLREEANRLVRQLEGKTQQEVELREVLEPDQRIALGIGRKGTTVADLQEAVTGLPPGYEASLAMVPPLPEAKGPVKAPDEKHYAPEEILPVEDLRLAVGYGVTDAVDVANPQATLQTAEATYNDIAWVGVVGKLDLTRQVEIIQKPYQAGKPKRTAPLDTQSPITVTRVEIQRRQVNPDGTTTEWENVAPAVPPEAAAELPTPPADDTDGAMVGRWLGALVQAQAQVRRLPFYNVLTLGGGQTAQMLVGEVPGVRQPDLSRFTAQAATETAAQPGAATPETAVAAAPTETKKPAAEGGSIFDRFAPTERKPSKEPTKTAETPEREHVFATLWVTDANVDPGNTYAYRMRAAILNPVYGQDNVEPEGKRWTLELVGPWSEPSAPATVPELSEFYFVGTFGDRVNLELHKWIHGQWIIVPSAPTYVGAPVVYVKSRARITVPGKGEAVEKDVEIAPGAFLVDLVRQFPYQPRGGTRAINTNVLLYSDEQGNLRRRIDWEDQERSRDDRQERTQPAAAPTGRRRAGR